MEAFGIIGFGVGSAGMTIAIIALGQIAELRKKLEQLEREIAGTGSAED